MKRPQLVSQGSLSRMLSGAQAAWERKDFQQCLDLLERASRLDPSNINILLQLGRTYGLTYDYAAAERCFEKAIRISGQKMETIARVAQMAVDFANHHLAEKYFQQALEQKDVKTEVIVGLAELYERLSRLDQASLLVDRALELNSACAAALLVRARLERRARRLEEAERTVRLLLNQPERTGRIRAYYELGTVLDGQGRYDEAMGAFLEAKAILRPDATPFLAKLQSDRERVRERQTSITADKLQRWYESREALNPSRRLALLGGYPRSGTTLLEQVLDSHPDIVSAEETQIFMDFALGPLQTSSQHDLPMSEVLESAQTAALQTARETYFRMMELHLGKVIGGRLLIDKNPVMTAFIPAYARIFPEIKLLIALRDPRDVCLSCFMQAYVPIQQGSAPYLGLDTLTEGYALKMGLWRNLAPLLKTPYLEVRYEDMVENLEAVSRRVLDFLGVSWDPDVLRFNERAQQKRIRTPSYADVTKPVFKTAVGRWRNYQKYFEPYLDTLEPFVKAFGYEL